MFEKLSICVIYYQTVHSPLEMGEFLRDFLVIPKRTLRNYLKILKKCFLGTT